MMPRRKRHAKAVGDGVMPGGHVMAACVSRRIEQYHYITESSEASGDGQKRVM